MNRRAARTDLGSCEECGAPVVKQTSEMVGVDPVRFVTVAVRVVSRCADGHDTIRIHHPADWVEGGQRPDGVLDASDPASLAAQLINVQMLGDFAGRVLGVHRYEGETDDELARRAAERVCGLFSEDETEDDQ